jgi:hypothetical protein
MRYSRGSFRGCSRNRRSVYRASGGTTEDTKDTEVKTPPTTFVTFVVLVIFVMNLP